MNLEKNQIDDLNVQLTLSIDAADYAEAEKKKLNDYRRKAEFKGFRKGMVPMGMIQKVYGEQALGEAINEIISTQIDSFINDNELRILGEPIASEDQPENEWKSGSNFVFKFDMGLSPKIELEPSKEDKYPYYKIDVAAAAKKEAMEQVLRQFGELQEAEKAGEEDYVIVDFEQEGKTVEGAYVAVRSVAEAAKASFVGVKSGDKFHVNVNEAFENETDRAAMLKVKKDELAELNPEFDVTVINVKTFVPAEANQETFDKAFGEDKVHSQEEFEKAIDARLREEYKQEADYRANKDIKAGLLAKADVKLPEEFLKRWLLVANKGKFTKEEIEKEFAGFAEDFKWQLVRGTLMKKYDLKVDVKDLNDAARGYVAYQYAMYGMPNVPEQMLEEAAKRILEDERQVRNLEESIEDQKVLEAVKSNVTLADKKISLDKFRALK